MSENKLKAVKSGFKWGALSSVIMILIKVFRSAFIPKILAVADYGLFTSVGVFTRYLQFSDFGARAYFSKNFPRIYFNKSKEEAQKFQDRILSFIVLTFVLMSLYLGVVSLFYSGENASFYKVALIALIPITVLSKLREFLVTYANSVQNYKITSLVSVYNDLLSVVLVVSGIYFYGAIGGILAMAIVELVLFFYAKYAVKIKFKLIFDKRLFKDFKNFISLFLISIAETISATVDQLFILVLFSDSEYGIYSLGLSFGWLMIAISGIFITTIQPKIMTFSKENIKKVLETLNDTLLFYFLSCLALLPFLEILIKFFVENYLNKPGFILGMEFYYIMVFSGLIKGGFAILKMAYIASDKEFSFIRLTIINIVLYSFGYAMAYYYKVDFIYVPLVVAILDLVVFAILYLRLAAEKANTMRLLTNLLLLVSIGLLTMVYQNYIYHIEDLISYVVFNGVQIALVLGFVVLFYLSKKDRLRNLINI